MTSLQKVKRVSHASSRFRFGCFVLSVQIVRHPSLLLAKVACLVLFIEFYNQNSEITYVIYFVITYT
jgi:hypothetical protein